MASIQIGLIVISEKHANHNCGITFDSIDEAVDYLRDAADRLANYSSIEEFDLSDEDITEPTDDTGFDSQWNHHMKERNKKD